MLLDSVAKQIPIGGFLVWHTRDHSLKTLDTLGAYDVPQGPSERMPRTYLLDGHQRLATLFAALTWAKRPDLLHGQGVRWPTYYDRESDPAETPFRFDQRKGDPPVTWLLMPFLFEPKRLFEYQKQLLQKGREQEADPAEVLAERFKDYQIPVVPLVSEDLKLVTESFVRINNQGKPMKETNMIRALAHSDCDVEAGLEGQRTSWHRSVGKRWTTRSCSMYSRYAVGWTYTAAGLGIYTTRYARRVAKPYSTP